MKQKTELFMSIALLFCAVFLAGEGALFMQNSRINSHSPEVPPETEDATLQTSETPFSSICLVVDPGHGGADPGKVGVNDVLEKDINLAISLRLKALLEDSGITVILTRDSDVDLAHGASNTKSTDMKNRCLLITEANPLFTVSIHQNSYSDPDVSGAQVFYYTKSAEGKNFAHIMQESLVNHLDPTNHRQPKANDTYYLLKKTPTPTIIVECGFLSNPTEAALLCTDDYQQEVAKAIYLGILNYLEHLNDSSLSQS